MLIVWKPGKFGQKSHKRCFLVHLALWIIFVGGLAAFVLIHGLKYEGVPPYAVICGPATNFWFFYTFTLPAEVTIFCGTLMSVFVIVKLHQVRERVFQTFLAKFLLYEGKRNNS